jgi:hypothetical protein
LAVVAYHEEAAMSSYQRIAEQVITLLTILISIVTVLRQAEKSGLPFELPVKREWSERAEKLPSGPIGNKVTTKTR